MGRNAAEFRSVLFVYFYESKSLPSEIIDRTDILGKQRVGIATG